MITKQLTEAELRAQQLRELMALKEKYVYPTRTEKDKK